VLFVDVDVVLVAVVALAVPLGPARIRLLLKPLVRRIRLSIHDDEKAFQETMNLAKNGSPEHQLKLGNYYRMGYQLGFDMPFTDGMPPGIYWYQRAAEQGNKKAQYHLMKCYALGIGTDIDDERAAYWRSKYKEKE